MKIGEFYDSVKEHLEQCSSEDKRLAFEALALKITATHEAVEITGIIPVDITATQSSVKNEPLLTIAQTSALLLTQTYTCNLATGDSELRTNLLLK